MKLKGLLFGGLVAAGAVLFVRSLTKGITYEFQKIKWLGRDGLKLRLALIYQLTNSNDISATVSKFNGKLKYGNYRLSDVIIGEDKAINILPGETEPMEVRFSVSPGALLGEILRFVDEKSGFKKFALTGWMSGKIGKVPFIVHFNEKLALAD